jgi:hypothetical protein
MSSTPEQFEYMFRLNDALLNGDQFHGMSYGNVMLSAPGVADTYDPDLVYHPTLAAGYWPGGLLDGSSYTALMLADSLEEMPSENLRIGDERLTIRRLILEGSIGAASLERYKQSIQEQPLYKGLVSGLGILAVPTLIDLCIDTDTPFSYIMSGPVEQSDLIPVGDRVAFLYFPYGVSPKPSLVHLRRAVQQMEINETP